MSALSVAVVHGINSGPIEVAELCADVERLVSGIVEGVPTVYSAVRWESTGTIAGDVWGMRSKAWLDDHVGEVTRQMFRARPDIVVAHSLGVPLAHTALTRSGIRAPLVGLGSPMGHPVVGRYLSMAGLRPAVRRGTIRVDIWNRDDAVCCLAGRLHSKLEGWRSVRVAVAGRLGLEEHSHKRYIYADGNRVPLHGATVRAIQPLLLAAAGIEVH